MLTFFPTPYPGEWWYSVLCRYHVRSGHTNHQTTIKELFGGRPRAAMGTLFPNSTIYQVISQLPGPWDCRNVILNHTLFPYFVRMYSLEQKQKMLTMLCSGESVTLTNIWKTTTKRAWKLRYCPICAREDTRKYGEPFWHREHQIPLATVCTKHHCQLKCTGETNPRLSETFYPLSMIDNSGVEERQMHQWEEPLSAILEDYLTLPLETGSTDDHNNLAQTLINQGYGVVTSSNTLSLNAPMLYQDLVKSYGVPFVQDVLGSEISAFVINRIVKWNFTSPERYAILQNFAGLSTKSMFSKDSVEDLLCKQLETFAKRGVVYGKKELAEQFGLKSFQLDVLSKKYNIKPFWEQNKPAPEKRADMIKIYLTSKEHQEIRQAAKKLGFRYDNHFVKYCIELALEKLD